MRPQGGGDCGPRAAIARPQGTWYSSSARRSDLDSWLERFLQDVFQHHGLVVLLIPGAVQQNHATSASEKRECLQLRSSCHQLLAEAALELWPPTRVMSEPAAQFCGWRYLLGPTVKRQRILAYATRPDPVDQDANLSLVGRPGFIDSPNLHPWRVRHPAFVIEQMGKTSGISHPTRMPRGRAPVGTGWAASGCWRPARPGVRRDLRSPPDDPPTSRW